MKKADNFSKYHSNKTAIEHRVLGAVIQYFVWCDTGEQGVSSQSLKKVFSLVHKAEKRHVLLRRHAGQGGEILH